MVPILPCVIPLHHRVDDIRQNLYLIAHHTPQVTLGALTEGGLRHYSNLRST